MGALGVAMRLAPHTVFMWALMVFAAIFAGSVLLLARTPWLGATFAPHPQGALVTGVAGNGPAAGRLQPGDVVVALADGAGHSIPLDGNTLLRDPDQLRSYPELGALLQRLSQIHALLQGPVTIALADGRITEIQPRRRTPVAGVSSITWYQLFWAAVSFFIVASVWSFRPGSPITRHFAISGTSLMLATLCAALYSGRGLGMEGGLIEKLLILDHLSVDVFLAAFLSLCWVYPRELPGYRSGTSILYACAAAWWIGDLLQLWPNLDFGYRGAQLAAYAAAVALLLWQWRELEAGSGEWGSALWFAATVLGGTGLYLALAPVPTLLLGRPLVERFAAGTALELIYLGIAVGIYRHGLFQIDRWVWSAWVFFGITSLTLLLDVATIYLLGVQSTRVFVLSVALLAWLYFPVRQWLWSLLSGRLERRDYRVVMPAVLKEILADGGAQLDAEAWGRLLQRLFAPLSLRPTAAAVPRPELRNGGVEMLVPGVAGATAMVMDYPDRGGRLFSAADERLLSGLIQLVTQVLQLKEATSSGALAERRRVASDLHDHVMPPLLSFVYRADDTCSAEAGRAAIRELRDIIQGLHAAPPAAGRGDAGEAA